LGSKKRELFIEKEMICMRKSFFGLGGNGKAVGESQPIEY